MELKVPLGLVFAETNKVAVRPHCCHDNPLLTLNKEPFLMHVGWLK